MTYKQAFDQFGKRRLFAKTTGHRAVNVLLFIGCIALFLVLTGCATQVTETCGTLPDGSECCTFVKVKK
jgi:hypothetical protein